MVRYRLVRDLGISGIQYSRWDALLFYNRQPSIYSL